MSTGFHNQRILFNDNGVLSDASIALNDFRSGSLALPFVAAEDALYVGAEMPFNHLYFDVSAANAAPSSVAIDTWTGTQWQPAVDILDFTASSGASLSLPGPIVFRPDEDNQGWLLEEDSEDVSGLAGTRIRLMYWLRIKWSADLDAGTVISHIGYRFNDDQDLFSFYPDLNNSDFLESFKAGKTDWKEQEFQAAQSIIMDLKKRNIIWFPGQILDFQLFKEPAIHKTAAIIFAGLGGSQADEALKAEKRYDTAKNLERYNLDLNADGTLQRAEKTIKSSWGDR